MRSFASVCPLVLALHTLAASSAAAQHVIALTVAPPTYESVAVLARSRAPAATLSSPLVAAIASGRLGTGVHAQAGAAITDGTEGVFGLSFDRPMGVNHRTRVGFNTAAIQGLCPSGGVNHSCILGYAFGVNTAGTIAHSELQYVSSPRSLTLAWAVDASTAKLTYRADGVFEPEDRIERTASVGFSLPILISSPSGRRVSTTKPDLRYRPYTALFLEPGFSVNQLWSKPSERGSVPHVGFGASILDIGPGFGVTATGRKMLQKNRPMIGAIAFSFHQRRPTLPRPSR